MLPQALPLQPDPVRLQVTPVLLVPVTVAVNCRWSSVTTCTFVGEILTATGGTTVTAALADLLLSPAEVAVTVSVAGLGTALGAVYRPAEVIVPQAEPEHPDPLTLQMTAVLLSPVTVALN